MITDGCSYVKAVIFPCDKYMILSVIIVTTVLRLLVKAPG